MDRIAVVLNAAAGNREGAKLRDRIVELLADGNRHPTVMVVGHGTSLQEAARGAVAEGCDVLVAGGGDGTVSTVAAAVVGSSTPFGVLPLGTLNHFAKDLKIPLDLEGAASVILAGRTRAVDVGEVSGRTFLNNSSLGVYPNIVRLRQRLQERGLGKWGAALWATLAVLRRRPFVGVRLRTPEQTGVHRTPFVLVGNNEYKMVGLHATTRESLTGGKLAVYVMNAERRRGLLLLGWRVLLGGVDAVDELELLRLDEVTVETKRGRIPVAVDGEVVQLESPLHYQCRPQSLRVLAP